MSVTEVNPHYLGQSSNNNAKKRTYNGTYLVHVDNPEDGQTLVENDYRIPYYGKPFQFGNASDPLAFCTDKRASRVSGTRLMWEVEVTWETKDQENDDNNDDDGNPSDNPFDWRDKWSWGGAKFTGPLEKAILQSEEMPKIREKGKDGPPVNAAGDIFDPPEERDFSRGVLRITKFLENFPSSIDDEYQDAINSDTFTIRKPGLVRRFEPYTVKMEPLSGSLNYHKAQNGVEIAYVQVEYELVFRKDGWRFKVLNRGFNRRQQAGDQNDNGVTISSADQIANRARRAVIKDDDDHPPKVPVPLDWDGQPLASGKDPIFIVYSGYKELPFGKLRL
jgi:hypothetical protein